MGVHFFVFFITVIGLICYRYLTKTSKRRPLTAKVLDIEYGYRRSRSIRRKHPLSQIIVVINCLTCLDFGSNLISLAEGKNNAMSVRTGLNHSDIGAVLPKMQGNTSKGRPLNQNR